MCQKTIGCYQQTRSYRERQLKHGLSSTSAERQVGLSKRWVVINHIVCDTIQKDEWHFSMVTPCQQGLASVELASGALDTILQIDICLLDIYR